MKKGLIIAGIVVVVLGVAAYFLVPRYLASQSSSQTTYRTQPAALGDLTAFVGGTGAARSNQSAVLIWQTSGTVAAVNVKKGDFVKKDAILSALDPTTLSPSVIQAQANLVTAKDNLNTLLSSTQARAQAYADLLTAQKAVDTATTERASLLYRRASQYTIDAAKANEILAKSEFDAAELRFNKVLHTARNDVIYAAGLSAYAGALQTYQRAQANTQYALDLPNSIDIAQADANIQLAQAKFQDAKTNFEKLMDGPNAADVQSAQANIASLQSTIDGARLVAPFDGTVTDVTVKVGDVVTPPRNAAAASLTSAASNAFAGTQAFQIDDLTHMYVDVTVSEVDINKIKIAQRAYLTFDAIAGKTYHGYVSDIAGVGTTVSNAVNYKVTVEIVDFDQEVKPGMTAAVNIETSNLQNVMLVPNSAIRVVNTRQLVYILQNNQPVRVPVTLGATNDTDSQVLQSNLQPGDLIILNPPATTTGGGFGGGPGGGGGGGIIFRGGG